MSRVGALAFAVGALITAYGGQPDAYREALPMPPERKLDTVTADA